MRNAKQMFVEPEKIEWTDKQKAEIDELLRQLQS
jgi:ribosomal protein L24E